jgi:hypothetical protein
VNTPAAVGAALVLSVLVVLLVWPLQRLGLAIERMLPDPHLRTTAPIAKFTGFDPRPMLRYRRDQLNQRITQDREQLAHISARLESLTGTASVASIEAARRQRRA